MSVMFSNKSDDEIRWMLDNYGIKHGPVVDSTRHLYEKKLKDAIANEKKAKLRPRPPSDKSYYGEEEDETPYGRRRPFLRDEDLRESQWKYREMDEVDNYRPDTYRMQATYRNMTQSVPGVSSQGTMPPATEENSSSGISLWVKFLVFLLVAAILFVVFISMEPAEEEPFKRLN